MHLYCRRDYVKAEKRCGVFLMEVLLCTVCHLAARYHLWWHHQWIGIRHLRQTTILQCYGCVRRIRQWTFNKRRTSCRHNRRSGRIACLCEDGAISNQRSQQTKTDHHVHLRVAWRWLWRNSVRHLMMRTCCFSRHPYNSCDRRIHRSSCPSVIKHTPISSHDVYLVPGRTNASNIQRCQEDIGPCLCNDMPFAHAYGAVWHHCTSVRHQQECTTEETICRWHFHAERVEPLGHDCRNHFNCWWAIIMEVTVMRRFYHLRYSRSPRNVSTDKTAVMESSLQPTCSFTKYHSFPAYYQIRQYGYR